ncbi:alpha/beta fold hydrolase [Blastococcus sp. SYSU DS0510]
MSARGVLAGAAGVAGVAGLRLHRAHRTARNLVAATPGIRTDDGVSLHVEVGGAADAPVTVVLAHGFGARAAMFDPQWAALEGHVRLVRYDQRGHGASGWAGVRSATPRRLGRDLGQVVDQLGGPGSVVVVGHSMGGMAVLALAAQRPELFGGRIAGVALMSTLAGPLPAAGQDAEEGRLRAALASAGAWLLWLTAPLLGVLHPFRSAPVQRLLRSRLFAGYPPEDDARSIIRMWQQTPAAVLAAFLPGLARYDRRTAATALRDLPVLVLAGAEDATIPATAAETLAERSGPWARLVLVSGAGHMVNLTHADAVNAALGNLLDLARARHGERRVS